VWEWGLSVMSLGISPTLVLYRRILPDFHCQGWQKDGDTLDNGSHWHIFFFKYLLIGFLQSILSNTSRERLYCHWWQRGDPTL
jgi:hypothetical protein